MDNDRAAAIDKIRRFSEKYLGGNLDNLPTFCWRQDKTDRDEYFAETERFIDFST